MPNQGGPVVVEHTGEVRYRYPFDLPRARGRYQPALELSYSSARSDNEGYGVGWRLSTAYVEVDISTAPTSAAAPPQRYWLSLGADRVLLVQRPDGKYLPEILSQYFELTYVPSPSLTGWQGVDAVGNTYRFATFYVGANQQGGRWYLSDVTDVDGNKTFFTYDQEEGAAALLKSVRYNNYPDPLTGAEAFASQVALSNAAMNIPRVQLVAGSVSARSLMLQTVRIQNFGPSQTGASQYQSLVRHETTYRTAADGGGLLLDSITVNAGETTQGLPPTRFDYEPERAQVFSLADGTSFALPAGSEDGAWIDVDGDGRPDRVWGGSGLLVWARNTTDVGSSQLTFASPVEIPNSSGVGVRPKFVDAPLSGDCPQGQYADSGLVDMNGDGLPDVVNTLGTYPAARSFAVRFARAIGGSVYFDAPVYFDVSQVLPTYDAATCNAPFGFVWDAFGNLLVTLEDVNGDGTPDFVIQRGGWQLFLGYFDGTAWGFTPAVPYANACVRPIGSSSDTWPHSTDFDINGDGLLDQCSYVPNPPSSLPFCFNEGRSLSSVHPLSVYQADGVTPMYWPSPATPLPISPSMYTCPTDFVLVEDSFREPRKRYGYVDLNGDGLPDWLLKTVLNDGNCTAEPCPFIVYWNMGGNLRKGPLVPMPWGADLYVSTRRIQPSIEHTDVLCEGGCGTPPDRYLCNRAGTQTFLGYDAGFVDLNGDGVPDYATSQDGWTFFRGDNGVGSKAPLLRAVTIPAGARYDIAYAPSTQFGAAREVQPYLATSVSLSGPRLAPNTTHYWYAGPVGSHAWYEPVKYEPRGFAESYSWDDVSMIVRKTAWATASHAFIGSPLQIEWGTRPEATPTSGPPTYSTFRRVSNAYSARAPGNSACVDASQEPAASAYPVVPLGSSATTSRFVDLAVLVSSRSRTCADVDDFGNVLKTFVDPDAAYASDAYYEHARYDTAATCKNCPAETKITTDAAGNTWLARSVFRYDSPTYSWNNPLPEGQAGNGHLNYVSHWVSTGNLSWYEVESATAYNARGAVYSRVLDPYASAYSYPVTEVYAYDYQSLRVTKTTTGDGTVSLFADAGYDSYGRLVWERGPYVLVPTSPIPTKAYAYDGFGRVIAVGRSIAGSAVNGAIAATEYVDTPAPSVKSYTFLAPLSFTAGQPPQRPDVKQVVSHMDGLGRALQVRERLGVAGVPDPSAQISQVLAGWRLTQAVKYDGAGRAVASLEPFFGGTDAYEKFEDLVKITGRRGTMTRFDPQGRPTCVKAGVYTALQADGDACRSSFDEDANYLAATAYRYRGFTASGRILAGAEAIPPTISAGMRGTEAAYRADGRLAWTTDGYGNQVIYGYDLLGRATTVTRRASGVASADQTATKVYDTLGRMVQEYDPNYSPGSTPSRIYEYDAAGRVTRVQLPLQPIGPTWARAEIRHGYWSLGRRTRTYTYEPAWSSSGVSFATREIAMLVYDAPYAGGAAYTYTAGRLSYVYSGLTTIAFGYDQNGKPTRRDQWFTGLSGAFTVTGSFADDGRLLAGSLGSGYSAAVTYAGRYDSSGQAARIDLGTTALWEAVPQPENPGGAYDALGRLPQVRSNGGQVDTFRNYSAQSGQLLSHLVRTSAAQVYGIDNVVYLGTKLRSFHDSGTLTDYLFGYDWNGRLTSAGATSSPGAALAQSYSEGYSFTDPSWPPRATMGNLEQLIVGANTIDYDYIQDRLTSQSLGSTVLATFLHDHAGRLTSRKVGATEVEGFAYDVEDHLKQVRRSGAVAEVLEYDPSGALMFRKVGTKAYYYVGPFATVTADVAPTCAGYGCAATNARVGVHVLLAGVAVATVRAPPAGSTADPAADVLYYHRDRQGSVVATTLTGGLVGVKYRYTPYGQVDKVEGDEAIAGSEFGYTGGRKLTGALTHLGARDYHAVHRRWLQPDTVDALRYTYANGDPVGKTDPSGRRPLDGAPVYTAFIPVQLVFSSYFWGPASQDWANWILLGQSIEDLKWKLALRSLNEKKASWADATLLEILERLQKVVNRGLRANFDEQPVATVRFPEIIVRTGFPPGMTPGVLFRALDFFAELVASQAYLANMARYQPEQLAAARDRGDNFMRAYVWSKRQNEPLLGPPLRWFGRVAGGVGIASGLGFTISGVRNLLLGALRGQVGLEGLIPAALGYGIERASVAIGSAYESTITDLGAMAYATLPLVP
jgi:RHS repeat-associated protein